MTPYEMYMKSLSAPAGPMGQTGEVYGQRDAVMRKGMRSPAAIGSGMPFGLAPTPGVIGDGVPKVAPGTAGPIERMSGDAIDSMWNPGGNSDSDMFARKQNREQLMERYKQPTQPQGMQPRDGVMGRPGGMAGGGRGPGLAGLAALAGSFMQAPGAANMAAPVNGGHFAGTGAGGLFNKGGMKFFG
jgi:hypothetical protein